MIRSIEIKGLRGIREGKLEEFTHLVILVGPNGSGKSTVLEGVLIGSSPSPGDAIGWSVCRHQGINRGGRWLLYKAGEAGTSAIKVTTKEGISRTCELELERTRIQDSTTIQLVLTDLAGKERVLISFQSLGNTYTADSIYRPIDDSHSDVRIVEAHATLFQSPLYQLYTNTVEQGRRKLAKEIIAEVVPGIVDVEILAEGDAPIVHLVFDDYSVPAALSGDGIQSLLRLTLELASRQEGVVLLEEPEVHQHPGAIYQSARAIVAAMR